MSDFPPFYSSVALVLSILYPTLPSLPLRPPCRFSLTVSRSLLALRAPVQYCGKAKTVCARGRESWSKKERERETARNSIP